MTELDRGIEHALTLLRSAERIASFSGAGLSAESGISTFRDAQTSGLWTKHDPMRLASPQGFAEEPDLVMDWYAHRRRQIASAQPNSAHLALAARRDITHITQNVRPQQRRDHHCADDDRHIAPQQPDRSDDC